MLRMWLVRISPRLEGRGQHDACRKWPDARRDRAHDRETAVFGERRRRDDKRRPAAGLLAAEVGSNSVQIKSRHPEDTFEVSFLDDLAADIRSQS